MKQILFWCLLPVSIILHAKTEAKGLSTGKKEYNERNKSWNPPANDDCENAILLTVNSDMNCSVFTSGTTVEATDSGIAPCHGESDDDVWYKFTAVETAHLVSFSNNNPVVGSDDLLFEVFSGSCGALTSISCSDDESMVTVNGLTPGETYYIRVYSHYDGYNTFDICVGTLPSSPPANDECTGAVMLTVNSDMSCSSKTSGNTVSATDSGIAPCEGLADDDVWYQFTAVGTSHVVALGNVGSVLGYSYPIFEVFSGSCGTLTSIACSDYEDYKVLNGLVPGETYYIRVFGDEDGYVTFDICIATPPQPPVNDACSGALSATTFPYSYTQTDAEGTTNNDGVIEVCTDDGMNDGTWFTFTGDGNTFDITVSMPSGSTFDPQIGVYSGSCDNLICEGTVDNEGTGDTETISIPTTVGTEYFVNVGHYNGYADRPEDVFTIVINNGSLGTSEVSKEKDKVRIYPNPFTEVLNITDISKVQSIVIADISGRHVKNVETPSSVLQLGDLKQGVYLMILNMKDGSRQTVKVIRK